ncbi:MAG: diguanylate cyclase [Hylemonella sp.]|nr:diguanylate cyclase [Hylemonella sp.]
MRPRVQIRMLVLGFAGLVLILAWQLKVSYDTNLARASDHADNLVQTIDGQLSGALRRMDATLHQIAARTPASALRADAVDRQEVAMTAMLMPYKVQFPELRDLFVWDGDGNILYDTLRAQRPRRPGSIAERPAFQYLRQHPEENIAFSELVRGNVSGQLTVATYVPIRNAQRQMIGMVTGSLNLAYFEQIFRGLNLSPGSVVFVRDSMHHRLVIRYPWIESEFNKSVRNSLQERIDAGETGGRDRFQARTDGEYRLYGFRKLGNYPFYVVVGVSERGALENWYRETIYVAVGVLFMALLMWSMLRRMRVAEDQRAAARRQADEVLELLREAINSVSAGLIIYDEKDRLVMCNQAQLSLFQGLGDVMQPGISFEELTREGLRRGLFPDAVGREEAWMTMRLREHRAADGLSRELELGDGRWLQFSEHHTPKGYTVGSRIDITERKKLETDLREQASTDALTGLPNRRYFLRRLEEELERVRRRTTREACVLMLDLDHFKRINDQYGHAAGDSLLRHFANLLRQEMRVTDTAGRMGGEEFALILPGSSLQAALGFAQRICDKLVQQPMSFGRNELSVTVSIGIASISDDDLSADAVLSRADGALYLAKDQGRNRVQLADKTV